MKILENGQLAINATDMNKQEVQQLFRNMGIQNEESIKECLRKLGKEDNDLTPTKDKEEPLVNAEQYRQIPKNNRNSSEENLWKKFYKEQTIKQKTERESKITIPRNKKDRKKNIESRKEKNDVITQTEGNQPQTQSSSFNIGFSKVMFIILILSLMLFGTTEATPVIMNNTSERSTTFLFMIIFAYLVLHIKRLKTTDDADDDSATKLQKPINNPLISRLHERKEIRRDTNSLITCKYQEINKMENETMNKFAEIIIPNDQIKQEELTVNDNENDVFTKGYERTPEWNSLDFYIQKRLEEYNKNPSDKRYFVKLVIQYQEEIKYIQEEISDQSFSQETQTIIALIATSIEVLNEHPYLTVDRTVPIFYKINKLRNTPHTLTTELCELQIVANRVAHLPLNNKYSESMLEQRLNKQEFISYLRKVYARHLLWKYEIARNDVTDKLMLTTYNKKKELLNYHRNNKEVFQCIQYANRLWELFNKDEPELLLFYIGMYEKYLKQYQNETNYNTDNHSMRDNTLLISSFLYHFSQTPLERHHTFSEQYNYECISYNRGLRIFDEVMDISGIKFIWYSAMMQLIQAWNYRCGIKSFSPEKQEHKMIIMNKLQYSTIPQLIEEIRITIC